jgi:hypothetical protein
LGTEESAGLYGYCETGSKQKKDIPLIIGNLPMPNLPPGFFPLEPICANCHFYGFVWRPPEEGIGHAYCGFLGRHFLYQLNERDPEGNEHTPAGQRHCEHWVQKGTL